MTNLFKCIFLFVTTTVYSQELFPTTIDWATKTEQLWNTSVWNNEARTLNYFNQQRRLSSQIFEWGIPLTPMNQYTYYYNSSDKPDSILDQIYDSPNQRWVNYILFTFSWSASSLVFTQNYYDTSFVQKLVRNIVFDSQYNITKDSSYIVDRKSNIAKPYMCTKASYSETVKVFDVYRYDTVSTMWIRSRSTVDSIYSNAKGNDSAIYAYYYGIIDPTFPPAPNSKWGLLRLSRSYSSYENDKLSLITTQSWIAVDSTWYPSSRQVFSYGTNSTKPISSLIELQRGKTSSWLIVPSIKSYTPFANHSEYFDLKGRKFIRQQCGSLPGQVQIQYNNRNNMY